MEIDVKKLKHEWSSQQWFCNGNRPDEFGGGFLAGLQVARDILKRLGRWYEGVGPTMKDHFISGWESAIEEALARLEDRE